MNPSRWFILLGGLFLIGVLIEAHLLITFSAMLAVVIGLAGWWGNHALDGVSYRRQPFYRRGFPGERIHLQLEVENRKLLPLSWLRVRDPWPKAVGPEDDGQLAPSHVSGEGVLTQVFSLRWYERVRREYRLLFRRRGVYRLGPAEVESGDIFGLNAHSRLLGAPERLTVFPALRPLEKFPFRAEDPFGELKAPRQLFEDPTLPMGVRPYQPGDSFRRIHWLVTARTGNLHAHVYQPVSAQVMVICLNISTFTQRWEGVNPQLMEYLIELAATLAYESYLAGFQVGLISNGTLSNSDQPFRILPGRSPDQLAHVLEALAGVTPVVSASFERLMLREAPRLPFGATLVVLTAITEETLSETLVQLKRSGRRILLISARRGTPPVIPGVRVIHWPYTPWEGKGR